jgi:mevalonate kinase
LKKPFYSNGKLLITGEYLVLDGALSLALPTQFGQSLNIETIEEAKLIWKSIDEKGNVWFMDVFIIKDNEILQEIQNGSNLSKRLIQIINVAKQLNPEFLSKDGFKVITQLDFSQFWGLGSSSTLINNIAKWAKIDAYQLLEYTFGGSGYDIACAQHNVPITYQLKKSDRDIHKIDFIPEFKNNLYFVHLNKKQNSRDGIAKYKVNKSDSTIAISEISDITSKIIECTSLNLFETLLTSHEHLISKIIKQKPVKELLFNDFEGAIKSLGAWGGDFILVTSKDNPKDYFKSKGYQTIISYAKMVL